MEVIQPEICQFVQELTDSSHVGEARRRAVRAAEEINMAESDCGAIAIAVTELGSNAIKHAQQGKLIWGALSRNGSRGLCILAIDKGPGIRDIPRALEDGYSTSGTTGSGLGAVRRLATYFDIYSVPDRGTCVLTEFWPQKKSPTASNALRLGAVSLAIKGEVACGDGWAVRTTPQNTLLLVVDGLGHGTLASEAAREAERVFAEAKTNAPAEILRDCHDALKKTRGAAAAIAAISKVNGTLAYAGVGNIASTVIQQNGRRSLASHNGTLGHRMQRLQEFNLPWDQGNTLIMHSDGLTTKWDLDQYPGIASRHPGVIASVLYRDFERTRDDVTVLVARNSD
jgi:anti-sigma regulatory factor (Ser/Thr protein kinase)/serine/threonine protein phosphatase PrpC